MQKENKWINRGFAGFSFIYYWIMALYKLMEAPIWQDEAMEFYCSIPVRGAIFGVTEYESMYERMAYIQQQPPLYNWFLCLWLQISENEFWFRFSSVVVGFVAMIGLFLVIQKLYHSTKLSSFSVIVISSIYIFMYYVKEAAEYIVLLCLIFWMIYVYLEIQQKITWKNICVFTILCILSVYTHYSAAFIVVPMAIQLLVYVIRQKEYKQAKIMGLSYAVAGIGGGIPLLTLFVLPQMTNSISTLGTRNTVVDITGEHLIRDFFESLMWVLRWCMTDYDRDWKIFTPVMWILVFALIAGGIICYRITSKKEVKAFLRLNLYVYLLYYIPTIRRMYAYGWFGNRYNLFLLPLWFVMVVVILHELIEKLHNSEKVQIQMFAKVAEVSVFVLVILFCFYGDKRIHDHWGKGDQRNIAKTWYQGQGYEVPTFVNFHQRYAFMYYITHHEAYQEQYSQMIHANLNLDSLQYSDEEWIAYLEKEVYPEGIPSKIYVISGQEDTVVCALESIGYQLHPVVDTTTKLFLLERQ